ncbi:hypothetical protein SOVF_210870 [Spinacia oleracea]|nr:hypothetical protein SOVF_210870 [Spinacia oleracea]
MFVKLISRKCSENTRTTTDSSDCSFSCYYLWDWLLDIQTSFW